MKDETLLDIAERNLHSAQILKRNCDDDGDLNIIAYLIQQSVELSLKHYIETYMGQDYPYTHDIGELIRITGKDAFPEIYPWSGTITLMESKTRYIKNYRLSLDVVNDVYQLANNLIGKIKNIEKETSKEREDTADLSPETEDCNNIKAYIEGNDDPDSDDFFGLDN